MKIKIECDECSSVFCEKCGERNDMICPFHDEPVLQPIERND